MKTKLRPDYVPMFRVWMKADKPGEGPYWYTDATNEKDACQQIARALKAKVEDFTAKAPSTK